MTGIFYCPFCRLRLERPFPEWETSGGGEIPRIRCSQKFPVEECASCSGERRLWLEGTRDEQGLVVDVREWLQQQMKRLQLHPESELKKTVRV